MLSKFDLRKQIRQLNGLDLSRAEYKTLKQKVRRITEGMSTVIGLTGGGEAFYRVRRNPSAKPTKTDELAAPPAKFVTGYQRCNGPFEPMFYTASRRSTALAETRIEKHDRAYLSQWIGRDQIPFNRLFDPHLTDEWQNRIAETSSEIQTFFETLFTRRIHSTFSDDYKITAAIADHMINGFIENERHKIHADGKVALRYPSVASKNDSYNTVMPPNFAADRLELLHVMEIEIKDVCDGGFSGTVLDNAYKFTNGMIDWTGNAALYPDIIGPDMSGEAGTLMHYDGEVWHLALNLGDYDPSQVDQILSA